MRFTVRGSKIYQVTDDGFRLYRSISDADLAEYDFDEVQTAVALLNLDLGLEKNDGQVSRDTVWDMDGFTITGEEPC